jgi:hypothetical protein
MIVFLSGKTLEKTFESREDRYDWYRMDGIFLYGKVKEYFGCAPIYVHGSCIQKIKSDRDNYSFFCDICHLDGYPGSVSFYTWQSDRDNEWRGLIVDEHDEEANRHANQMVYLKEYYPA